MPLAEGTTTKPQRPQPRLEEMPAEPPVQTLQREGVQLTRAEAVDRIRRITDAHERAFGVRPTPAVVRAVLVDRVPTDHIDRLFDLPRTRREARARFSARDFRPAVYEFADVVEGVAEQPGSAVARLMEKAELGEPFYYGFGDPEAPRELPVEAAGLASIGPLKPVEKYVIKPAMLATAQVTSALALGLPTLGFVEGRAVYRSIGRGSIDPFVEANVELGEGIVESYKETYQHPLENPGYIFLDLFGLLSVGAGGAARVSSAAKGGGAKALLRRPAPGVSEIRVTSDEGELVARALNSENALARLYQRGVRSIRQKRSDKREFREPAGALVAFTRKHLSFERKVGREFQREQQLLVQLRSLTSKELDRVTGWSEHVSKVQARLPAKARRGLTRGEQMAVFIESLDEPGDFAARAGVLRRFHEEMLNDGVGDAAAHQQKLRDIRLAEQAMRKPSERFQRALALARQASEEQQLLKVTEFGLNPVTAEARISKPVQVLKNGETFAGALARHTRESERIAKQTERLAARRERHEREELRNGSRNEEREARLEAAEKKLASRQRVNENVLAGLRQFEEQRGQQLSSASFYVKLEPERHATRPPKNPFRGMRVGRLGLPARKASDYVRELNHEFTGSALRQGDYRIDTTRLVGESVGRAVRASQALREYRALIKASSRTPRSEFDRPIRLTDDIPDSLRKIVNATDEGELVADEAGVLSRLEWDEMVRELFPGEKVNGQWVLPKGFEGKVRFVDERLLGGDAIGAPVRSSVAGVAQALNEPFRAAILYLRPAYWVNLLGSTSMALVYQGPLAAPNIVRALFAEKLYGPRVATGMAEMVGAGKFVSFVDDTLSARVSRRAAAAWNTITDQRLRMATGFYYARQAGIKTKADWHKLLDDAQAGDTAALRTVGEIKDRTNKAMVQFDNLTWPEQNILRHVVFVYPWVRGASIWSLRTIVERPLKSDILAHIGDDALDWIEDEFLGRVPDWFESAGYIPVRFSDGKPTIVNPSNLNTWSTLNQVLHQDVDEFLGPLGEFVVRGVTGRDQFGNEYPGGKTRGWVEAAKEVMFGLPQLLAYERGKKKPEAPLPPFDVGDRDSLAARVNAALKQTVFSPGWLNGYGNLILGGAFTERTVNKEALLARWYKELPFEERQAFNRELVGRALKLQGELLDRSVPRPVREAIDVQFQIDQWDHEWQEQHERDFTPLEQTLHRIDFYEQKGYATAAQAEQERKATKALASADEHSDFRSDLFKKYADPEETLSDWDSDVRRVAALKNPKIVNRRLAELATDGLLSREARKIALTPDQLETYGRTVLAYAEEARRRRALIDQVADPEAQNLAWAEYREWLDTQDKPVSVNGVTLPSPARIEWARYGPEKRKAIVADTVRLPWQLLSRLDKELLGRKVDAKVSEGWRRLEEIVVEYRANQPPGARTLPRGYEAELAKYVDRYFARGFYKDWLFSREPLVRRLQVLPKARPAHPDWAGIEQTAATYAGYLKSGDYQKQGVRDAWHDYVKQTLEPWVATRPKLKEALDVYGSDFLYRLLD